MGFVDEINQESSLEFRFGGFDIDRWMRQVPRGYLADTHHGYRGPGPIPEAVREQGMLRQVYLLDLALFIGAELTATRVAAGLTRLAHDEASLSFLATQTLDEARHYEAFANRFRELGLIDEQRNKLARDYMSPRYREFLDLLLEAVDRDDFETGVVGLNIILEGMAFPLYEYEMRYWAPFDPALSQIIWGAFKDECRHVGYGEKRVGHILKTDVRARNRVQRKVTDLTRLMGEVFDEFLSAFVGLYDIAVQDHLDRVGELEIIPGRMLAETSAEEQIEWLRATIEHGHKKRLGRIGLELS